MTACLYLYCRYRPHMCVRHAAMSTEVTRLGRLPALVIQAGHTHSTQHAFKSCSAAHTTSILLASMMPLSVCMKNINVQYVCIYQLCFLSTCIQREASISRTNRTIFQCCLFVFLSFCCLVMHVWTLRSGGNKPSTRASKQQRAGRLVPSVHVVSC